MSKMRYTKCTIVSIRTIVHLGISWILGMVRARVDTTRKSQSRVAIPEAAILVGLAAKDDEAVIRRLSERLYEMGYVKATFADAVVARERSFPTGLPTPIPVAIPHADPDHCNRPAIAVAVLSKPIPFGEMGAENSTLSVDLVFLLALDRSESQVEWLRKLVDLFSDVDLVQSLRTAGDAAEIASCLRVRLFQQS